MNQNYASRGAHQEALRGIYEAAFSECLTGRYWRGAGRQEPDAAHSLSWRQRCAFAGCSHYVGNAVSCVLLPTDGWPGGATLEQLGPSGQQSVDNRGPTAETAEGHQMNRLRPDFGL